MSQWSPEEYQAYLASQKGQKKSKYGNTVEVIDGVRYDSKANQRYQAQLDLRVKAGEIKGYDREVDLPIIAADGTVLGKWRADFILYLLDGTRQLIDVKSKPTLTASFRLKKKLIETQYGEQIICLDSKTFQPIPFGRKKKNNNDASNQTKKQ